MTTDKVDKTPDTFDKEFDELTRWPYSLHAINDTLDVHLIEGRGKQLLFQGLNNRTIVSFVGSGVSQAYGHLSWRDWLELQLGTVQDGAQLFIECASGFRGFKEEIEALVERNGWSKEDRDALKGFLRIKSNQIAYPQARAELLQTTLNELRLAKSSVGGELAPLIFQVGEQLRQLIDKAWPVVLRDRGRPNINPAELAPTLHNLLPEEITSKLGKLPSDYEGFDSAKNLVQALLRFEAWTRSYMTKFDFAKMAKILLVDECALATESLTRAFSDGTEYGRKPATPTNLAEVQRRVFADVSLSDSGLRRDIPGLQREPGRYAALSYYKSRHVDRITKDLLDDQAARLPEDRSLLEAWRREIKAIQENCQDNSVSFPRQLGSRITSSRTFVAPSHRFVIEMMAALLQEPLTETAPTVFREISQSILEPKESETDPAKVVRTDLDSRLSITDRELDPIDKLADRLGIRQFLTTNYDFEIERYFQDIGYRRFSGQSTDTRLRRPPPGKEEHRTDDLGGVVRDFSFSRERAADLVSFSVDQDNADASIYHLHGTAEEDSRIVMTERDYMDLYLKRDANRTIVDDGIRLAFSSSPILFAGLGMEEADILRPLRQFMSDRTRATNRTAIALVPALNDTGKRVTDAANLFLRYGVHSIYYGDGYVRVGNEKSGRWQPIDWLHRTSKLLGWLLDTNRAMLLRLQHLLSLEIERAITPDPLLSKRVSDVAKAEAKRQSKPRDDPFRKSPSDRFAEIVDLLGEIETPGATPKVKVLATLFGKDSIGIDDVINTRNDMAPCIFRSLKRPRGSSGTLENETGLELPEDSPKSDPYLKFELELIPLLLARTIRHLPGRAGDPNDSGMHEDFLRRRKRHDPDRLRFAMRELRARIVALEGLKNSVQTAVFCAAIDNVAREWRNWWEFWRVSPPHRRAEFQVCERSKTLEPGPGTSAPESEAFDPRLPIIYVRHLVDNVITRMDQNEKRQRSGDKDAEAPVTGIRSFDNFLEAVAARTALDAEDHRLERGRRMHLIVGERGVGKGTFTSAFASPQGLQGYIQSSWRDTQTGLEGKKFLRPDYLAAMFVNLSFSIEIASTFDMILDALAKCCAAMEIAKGSDFPTRLEAAKGLLARAKFIDPDKSGAIAALQKQLHSDSELFDGLSRLNKLRRLMALFTERATLLKKGRQGGAEKSIRFLLLFNAIDLLHFEGGVPKNREIRQLIELLTGDESADKPFDLVMVGGNRNLGPPFVTKSSFARRYAEVTNRLRAKGGKIDTGSERKNNLKFVTIVRSIIDAAGIQNVRLREVASGIDLIAPTRPRPNSEDGAAPIPLGVFKLGETEMKLSTRHTCNVIFARTVRAEALLIDSFPLLASILFAGDVFDRIEKADPAVSSAATDEDFAGGSELFLNFWTGATLKDGQVPLGDYAQESRCLAIGLVAKSLTAMKHAYPGKVSTKLDRKITEFKSVVPLVRAGRTPVELDGLQSAYIHAHHAPAAELMRERYADLDDDSRDEWQSIRNVLGANRFCLTILMAAAERLALTALNVRGAKAIAERFLRKVADLVNAAGNYQREDIVVSEVLEAYQSLHKAGAPRLDMNLHRLVIRHLAVTGAPVSADVLVRMPEIRNYFDEHFRGSSKRRTNLLVEALGELSRRGLIFRLAAQQGLVSHWETHQTAEELKNDFDNRQASEEYRYALHRLVQRNVIRKLGAGPREFVEINSFAPSIYASMPTDLPRLNADSYRFLRTLVASLSQYPDNPGNDASIENWHYGAAQTATRVQALRAALSVARSTFSIAVVSRFELPLGGESEFEEQRGHFENYRLQLRWIIRKAWHISHPTMPKNLRAYRPDRQFGSVHALYRDEIVWLYNECGVTCLVQGNLNDAVALLRQALELNQKIEGPVGGGMQHNCISLNLAIAQIERGRLESARRRLSDICSSEAGSEGAKGRIWHIAHGYLGLIHHITGDTAAARRHYEHAIEILRAFDDSRACSVFCRHLGDIERLAGDFKKARVEINSAIDFAQNGGHDDMLRKAQLAMLRLEIAEASDNPNFTSAGYNVRLNAIAEYATAMEMPGLTCEVMSVRANLLVMDGEARLAGQMHAEAMALAKRNGMRLRLNSALTGYARVLAMRDQKEQAKRLFGTAMDLAKRQRHQLELRRVEVALANLQAEPTRRAEVSDIFR